MEHEVIDISSGSSDESSSGSEEGDDGDVDEIPASTKEHRTRLPTPPPSQIVRRDYIAEAKKWRVVIRRFQFMDETGDWLPQEFLEFESGSPPSDVDSGEGKNISRPGVASSTNDSADELREKCVEKVEPSACTEVVSSDALKEFESSLVDEAVMEALEEAMTKIQSHSRPAEVPGKSVAEQKSDSALREVNGEQLSSSSSLEASAEMRPTSSKNSDEDIPLGESERAYEIRDDESVEKREDIVSCNSFVQSAVARLPQRKVSPVLHPELPSPATTGNPSFSQKESFDYAYTEVLSHSAVLISPDELEVVQRFRLASVSAQNSYFKLMDYLRTWTYWKVIVEQIPNSSVADLRCLSELGFLLSRPRFDVREFSVTDIIALIPRDHLHRVLRATVSSPSDESSFDVDTALEEIGSECTDAEVFKMDLAEVLWPEYVLNIKAAGVFRRLFLLFSPPSLYSKTFSPVFNQLVRLGKRLPSLNSGRPFEVRRISDLFVSHAELKTYAEACEVLEDLRLACKNKVWSFAVEKLREARSRFEELSSTPGYDVVKPKFLRRFTPGSVYAAALTFGLRAFEVEGFFSEAVEVLKLLLAQNVYLEDFRGLWFERLTRLLLEELRDTDEVVLQLQRAFDDLYVTTGFRRTLLQMSTAILQKCFAAKQQKQALNGDLVNGSHGHGTNGKVKKKKPKRVNYAEDVNLDLGMTAEQAAENYTSYKKKLLHKDASLAFIRSSWNTECLTCQRMPQAPRAPGLPLAYEDDSSGHVYRYSGLDANGQRISTEHNSLEEVVIEHYRRKGFTMATSGKGKTWVSIFAILFWDILYESLPDAFLSTLQISPSDLNSEEFYERRKSRIDARLSELQQDASSVLQSCRSTWERHAKNRTSSLVSWDRFESFDSIMTMVELLGSNVIFRVCEKLAKDYRFARDGMPDLVVWNPALSKPDEKPCRIIQVKSATVPDRNEDDYWLDQFSTKFYKDGVLRCEVFFDSRRR